MDVTRRSFALAGFTALGSAALSGRAWADDPASVRGVLVQSSGAASRITVALDRQAMARTFFLADPNRFVIDLANTRLALPHGAGEGPGEGVVSRYRYGPRPDGSSRLVLDLAAPANLVRQELGSRRSPELRFDLVANAPLAIAPAPVERRGRNAPMRTIVIDAGHGGRDPGAIGTTGVREKDVVLDSALKLRDALEHRGRYQVILTRDADRFVEHAERVRVARSQNAHLFIARPPARPSTRSRSAAPIARKG
jgi:N-acetylmuramoyl-L-alanine amidase